MMNEANLDAMFRQLTAKYAVQPPKHWRLETTADKAVEGRATLVPGWAALDCQATNDLIPLLPWRSERRFVELKRLVDTRTVEPVVMCRFSCLTTGTPMGLKAILYREFDLVEWLTGSPIVTLYASMAAERFANVLVRVASGVVCSVEAGTTLPAGSRPAVVDRHEMIARQGVASDRVVDTQVPQSSIYTFTPQGTDLYTDTDAELFGLENDDVNLVRAAYEVAAQPDRVDVLQAQHQRLATLVTLAYQSDRTRQCLAVKGGCSCSR
jgi:hypothetical protein